MEKHNNFFTDKAAIKNETNNSEHAYLEVKLDSLYNAHFNENSPGAALLILYDGKKLSIGEYFRYGLPAKEYYAKYGGSKDFIDIGILPPNLTE